MGTIKRKNIFIEEFGVDGEDPKKKSAPNTKPNTVTQEPKKTGNIFVDEFGVKKKEASEVTSEPSPTTAKVSSPLAYQLPSETEAKETILDKSFLDRDIQINAVDFLSNPNYKPSKELNLSSAYQQARQQRYDQKKRMTELDIKSSPEGLAAYTKKRVAELNSDIENAKDNLKGIFKGQGYGAKVPTEIRWQYEKDLADKVSYKNNLKSAVAAEVIQKVLPAYLEDGRPFNPRQMSRDIIKVADPEQEFIFQKAEENGAGLPGITNAILERTGIDLSKEYFRNLPQDEFTQRKLSEIEALESDFDERNFELTAQRVKEKLGVYFYNHADDPITGGKSGFWGYSAKNIESAINDPESGLTPSEKKIALEYVLPTEKKLFFSTDIPGSGFFRAGKNAIERSVLGVGNTISGWLGQRDDADRAYDLLNNEVEESRFRAPGENPTLKSELRHLENKEKKEGLSDIEKAKKVELEKFVDVRNGFSKFKDGVGDLTGQVMQIALLTRGVGMVGKGLMAVGEGGGALGGLTTSALGNALSNETVGLFLTSYLNSYDNYKQQSLQLMPGVENAANRDAYAKVMAGVEGLSERIFVNTKILKAFTKSASPTIADITNRFINKEITQQVARQELNTALQKYMKPFAKEFAKSTVQESTEEAVVDLADGISQSIFGGQPFDIVKTGQQALNTFLTTALHSPLVAGMAAHGKARQERSQNAFMRSAIVDMANNPAAYLKSVSDLQLSGQITQDEANEKIQLINSASKYLKEIPENITVAKTGEEGVSITDKQLDYPESATYLIHRLNEGILKEKIENLNDDALKPSLEAELKRSIEIRKGIINGSIGVTPDIEEVTDDSNKAQKLGVLDANQVPNAELIGTPFKRDQSNPEEVIIAAAKQDKLGMFSTMINENPAMATDVLRDFAQQIYGITNTGEPLQGGSREGALSNQYSYDIIEAARNKFPTPESTLASQTEVFNEKGALLGKEIAPILQRINDAEYINENDLNAAADRLYSVLDEIENSQLTPEQKQSSANLIEPIIQKIEGYEFRTKTENRTVTETKATQVARKTPKREIKPALEQSSGTTATITDPEGRVVTGTLNIKSGQYVLDVPGGTQRIIGEKAITDRDLTLPTEEEMENPIGFDEQGNVATVTFKTRNGNLVTISDPEKALDLAIQIRADMVGEIDQEVFDTVYEEISKEVPTEVLVNQENENIQTGDQSTQSVAPKEGSDTKAKPDTTGKKTSSAEIFDAITEAEKSKVRRKDKLAAVEKSVSEFGDEGKKAFEIHKNFESIVKQLQKSNKLKVKC